jgi:hypothetical protein
MNEARTCLAVFIAFAFAFTCATTGGCAANDEEIVDTVTQGAGNGAPSGSHYTLNIIGVSNPKAFDSTSNGRVIFVPLKGNTQINLREGPFQVLDANGTDGTAAFQLPSPDPTSSGTTTYSVYARALGKPGGSATMQTCATDPTTGDVFCSVYTSVMTRSKGGSQFTNVSRELLYIYADLDGDGKVTRYPLFDSALQDYFWSYGNNGLKLAQLRFYAIPTTVPAE